MRLRRALSLSTTKLAEPGDFMCTLTVLREDSRLLVTMNRDDLAARPEAAPTVWPNADPTFVAPKDLQAGGTWIGMNELGVIACLLNRYDSAPAGRISRGSIVPEAMRHGSVEAASSALKAIDHNGYSPYTVLIVGLQGAIRLDWTGAELTHHKLSAEDDIVMATSSSWRLEEVKAQREALWRQTWCNGGEAEHRIATFHSRREREHDAWSPMMQRPQSQTKSVTQIELTPSGGEMRYWTRDAAIATQLTAPDATVRVGA